jgi:hypothetical protein
MKRMLLTTASIAAALTLSLSGCGSNDNDTATAASSSAPASSDLSGDPADQVVKYAQCLQQNGLAVKINAGDGFTLPKDYDEQKKEAAEAACRSVAPPGMYDKPSAEELDKNVKLAECLRASGVDVKDPTADKPQLQVKNPPSNMRALGQACRKKLGIDNGSGNSQ